MALTCPKCRSENAPGAKFCNQCGGSLAQASGDRSSISDRLAPVSERRIVSVLFADIKDYTSLSEALDAEQVQDLVGGLFGEFSRVIESQGGFVDKFMGDAVLALFGAPKSHGDDAARACACALEMQRLAAQYRPGGVKLQVRVGIDTGEVVAGNLGQRGEYTAVGDAVNTANRIQSACEPGNVYIGEATAQLIKDQFRLTPLPPRPLKGKAAPQALYRLEGQSRTTEHFVGRFVGREHELDALLAMFKRAQAENRGQFVLVRGEAGMGKSRLSQELARRLRLESAAVQKLIARFPPTGREPLHGMRRLLRSALEGTDGAAEGDWGRALQSNEIRALGEGMAGHLRFVLGLENPGSNEENANRMQAVWVALKRLLEARAANRPLLVVMEDLHWADEESLEFFKRSAQTGLAGPVLFMALGRPEALEALGDLAGGAITVLELAALPADDVGALASGVLLDGVCDKTLTAMVAQRAGGNPFVSAELLKGLREQGLLRKDGRVYRLASSDAATGIPAGLRGILTARMDALPQKTRGVLAAASVLGREFYADAAAHVAGETVDEALDALLARGMLTDLGREAGRRRLQFCHALLRETAYAGLLKRDRQVLHAAAADWLAKQGGDDTGQATLGHHREQAGQHEAAARAYFKAGMAAKDANLYGFAHEQLRKAQAQFEAIDAPVTLEGMTPEQSRIALLLALADAAVERGQAAEGERCAREVLDLGNSSPAESRIKACIILAGALSNTSRYQEAMEATSLALSLCGPPAPQQAELRRIHSNLLAMSGRCEEALEFVLPLRELPDLQGEAAYYVGEAYAHAYFYSGRYTEAVDEYKKNLAIAQSIGDRVLIGSTSEHLAVAQTLCGRSEESVAMLEAAIEQYRASGILVKLAWATANYAGVLRWAGRLEESLAQCEIARTLHTEFGNYFGLVQVETIAGLIFYAMGRFNDAATTCERSLAAALKSDAKRLQFLAYGGMALNAQFRGQTTSSLEYLARAVELGPVDPGYNTVLADIRSRDAMRRGDLDETSRFAAQVVADLGKSNHNGRIRSGLLLAWLGLLRNDSNEIRRTLDAIKPELDALPVLVTGLRTHFRVMATVAENPDVPAASPALSNLRAALAVDNNAAVTEAAVALSFGLLPVTTKDNSLAAELAGLCNRAVAAMETGGRADWLYGIALYTRGQLRANIGDEAGARADREALQKTADNLQAPWLTKLTRGQ